MNRFRVLFVVVALLFVLPACDGPTAPGPAVLSVSPTVLSFEGTTSALQVTISNTGDQDLVWELRKNRLWLSASTFDGQTAPGGSETLVVTINRGSFSNGGLPADGSVTVESNGGTTAVLINVQ